MESNIQIDTENAEEVKQVLEPSLASDKRVSYTLDAGKDSLDIKIQTDGIGPLRGCTNTVFRLASLAIKTY